MHEFFGALTGSFSILACGVEELLSEIFPVFGEKNTGGPSAGGVNSRNVREVVELRHRSFTDTGW